METRKSDKHQLLTQTCTNQTTSWLMHNLSTFGARKSHGQTRTHKTSKWHFVLGLPSGSFEIPKLGTLATLGTYNFVCGPLIKMRSEAKS
jgi:hypothetical protein